MKKSKKLYKGGEKLSVANLALSLIKNNSEKVKKNNKSKNKNKIMSNKNLEEKRYAMRWLTPPSPPSYNPPPLPIYTNSNQMQSNQPNYNLKNIISYELNYIKDKLKNINESVDLIEKYISQNSI